MSFHIDTLLLWTGLRSLFMHPDPNLKSKLLFISNTSQWRDKVYNVPVFTQTFVWFAICSKLSKSKNDLHFSTVRKVNCFASSKFSCNIWWVYSTSDFNRIIHFSSFPLAQSVPIVHRIRHAAEPSTLVDTKDGAEISQVGCAENVDAARWYLKALLSCTSCSVEHYGRLWSAVTCSWTETAPMLHLSML